jgi:ATP-binding cassette, subfamily D (ALD), peroxisomal long-chain fatty acid import protein
MPGVLSSFNISHERQKSLALIAAILIILRSHIPASWPKSINPYGSRLTDAQLEQVRQEVYREEADGSTTLFVPFRGRVSKVNK